MGATQIDVGEKMSESKIPQIAMLVFLLSFFILPNSGLAKYSGGTGDVNDPYQISTADDLLTLRADTNDYGKNFVLTADIDLDPNLPGGQVFTTAVIAPDGDNSNQEFNGIAFAGVFNGAGHKIINLTIDTNGPGNEYLGLFGSVAGEVKNLGIENVGITDGNNSWCLGGLAGWNDGTVSNCFSTGAITGGNVSYCLGGLAGWNNGDISNCFSTGTVTGGDYSVYLGGLAGYNYCGTISNCFATGTVTGGNEPSFFGGLVGENDSGSVSSSFWDTETSGQTTSDGGTGKTTAEMKTLSTFTDAGWDFVGETTNGTEDIWAICEGISYPKLAWQFIVGDSDNDKDVDFVDFALMALKWLQADSNLYCGGTDLTGDGWVDLNDLNVLADNWLEGL
jgi:hypothetical protein